MAHTVIPPPRGTTATLEKRYRTHTQGNINGKTIPERDREVRDFDVTLLASAITRRRHLEKSEKFIGEEAMKRKTSLRRKGF